MRRPLAALLLTLLAAALVPAPANAQEASAAPVVLLEDGAGDIETTVAGAPVTTPAGSWDAMDLRSLSIEELPNEFLLHVTVASLADDPRQSILAAVQYEVLFRHADTTYRARGYHDGSFGYGALERLPPGTDPHDGYGDFVTEVPVAIDVPSNTLTFSVPRLELTDSEGATPYPGRALDLFAAQAGFLNHAMLPPTGDGGLEDRMPDDGFGDVALPIAFGIQQAGDLRLDSDEPFRASNGEAATFVFRVNATNLGTEEAVAEFVALGQPASWEVSTPGLVRLAANASVEFPIVVRTSFAHAHGSATAFTLELVGQDGSSVGRVQIGLRYPKIAQPAGHHNEVHLHNIDDSADPARRAIGLLNYGLGGYDYNKRAYFNTAPDDPADAGTPVPGYTCEGLRVQEDNDTVGTTYCWEAALMPGLEMGLDFDLAGTGSYTIPIHSLAPQPGARVQGQLVYYAPLDEGEGSFPTFLLEPVVVADLLPSDRVDLGADGSHSFMGTIQPREDGDYLPYVRGAGLELHLQVRTARPDNVLLGPRTEPELMPGGLMQLPLLEYEDLVDEAYGVDGVLHLVLDGDAHRLANPGDTLVYTVTIHNADGDDHDVAAAILGSNRAWARVVGSDGFGIDADASRTLTLAVTVPDDALDGDVADLVVEVASQDDVAVRALLRLVTTVDTESEHPDDAALLAAAPAPKDAPGPALPAVLLALALLAAVARRR